MIYTIKKGKHRISKLFALLLFWIGPKRLIYRVRFAESWKQSWPGDDQNDVSKVLGMGCLNLWYLLRLRPPHHYMSTRLGVDYNEELNTLDAYEYLYYKGMRFFTKVFEFQFNTDYHIHLYKTPDSTQIAICDTKDNTLATIDGPGWRGISYLLRPYVGGNNPARRDTLIKIDRL